MDEKSSDGHGGGCEGDARMAGGHTTAERRTWAAALAGVLCWQVAARTPVCRTLPNICTLSHPTTIPSRNACHSSSQISRACSFCLSSIAENCGRQSSSIHQLVHAHLYAVSGQRSQRAQPRDLARHQDLIYVRLSRFTRSSRPTWKKSYVRPMFPNTDGSSDERATGTPWFSMIGRGCRGIEDVKRFGRLYHGMNLRASSSHTRTSFLPVNHQRKTNV